MVRGPKRHLKRLNAPNHWMLDKLGGIWAPRPTSGPHKLRESIPLIVILRNRLKYALTKKEVETICIRKLIQVDHKTRTNAHFPAGFMDVLQIPRSGDNFRLMYDTKGRFVLQRIDEEAANFKLCKVQKRIVSKRGVPTLVTHDGRSLRYPDPVIKALDTVKLDLNTGKISGFIKFDTGATVMITKGHNIGRVGKLVHRDRHPGSFDIVHVKDEAGNTFATRLENVFVIGTNGQTDVLLPKGNGIKRPIVNVQH